METGRGSKAREILGPWRGSKPEVHGLHVEVCTHVRVCVPVYSCMCMSVSVNVCAQDKETNTLASIEGSKRRQDKERHLEKPKKADAREGMASVHVGGWVECGREGDCIKLLGVRRSCLNSAARQCPTGLLTIHQQRGQEVGAIGLGS